VLSDLQWPDAGAVTSAGARCACRGKRPHGFPVPSRSAMCMSKRPGPRLFRPIRKYRHKRVIAMCTPRRAAPRFSSPITKYRHARGSPTWRARRAAPRFSRRFPPVSG
jgi:hypothetical protein